MKDRNMECKIVEELLPGYIENLTEPSVGEYIQEHLKQCDQCRETYMQMKSEISIELTKEELKRPKDIVRYVNSIKLWYLLCPMFALLFVTLEWSEVLRVYKGGIAMFAIACILSEVYHRGSWWDQDCIDLQDKIREGAKKKWGIFYIRPVLFAIPSILVLLILELLPLIR